MSAGRWRRLAQVVRGVRTPAVPPVAVLLPQPLRSQVLRLRDDGAEADAVRLVREQTGLGLLPAVSAVRAPRAAARAARPGRSVSDAEDVLQAAARRAQALADGDADGLRALMHPALRWTTFRGAVLDLEAYVDGNTGGSLRWHGQRLLEPDVVVVGDTAVLTAVVVDEVEGDDGPETFRLLLTQTWVREDGRWRCLAGHAGPRLLGAAA